MTFLEHCLKSDVRIVTPDMILGRLPLVYECEKCGLLSLKSSPCATARDLDFPNVKTTYFVDEDMLVYVPPPDSVVWKHLNVRPADAGSSKPEPVPEEPSEQPSPPQAPQP